MTHWWKRSPTKSERRNKALRALNEDTVAGKIPSSHSELGMTIPLLLEMFEDAGVPYIIKAVPGQGYAVERYKEFEELMEALHGLSGEDRAK